MSLSKLEARITVPTGGYSISVTDSGGTSSVTVAAGLYYLTSTTSLLTTLVTALNADSTLAGTYSCTVDDDIDAATGRVTLAATGGGNISVTWTSTVLRDLLGFTAGLSGAATYTSTKAAKPLFLPGVPRANPLVPDGHAGLLVTDASTTIAPSGESCVLVYANRRVDSLEFRFLLGRKTWTVYETYVNESFESFWANNVALGAPLRYHYDRATDGTYVAIRAATCAVFPATTAVANWCGNIAVGAATLWNIGPLPLIGYV